MSKLDGDTSFKPYTAYRNGRHKAELVVPVLVD